MPEMNQSRKILSWLIAACIFLQIITKNDMKNMIYGASVGRSARDPTHFHTPTQGHTELN